MNAWPVLLPILLGALSRPSAANTVCGEIMSEPARIGAYRDALARFEPRGQDLAKVDELIKDAFASITAVIPEGTRAHHESRLADIGANFHEAVGAHVAGNSRRFESLSNAVARDLAALVEAPGASFGESAIAARITSLATDPRVEDTMVFEAIASGRQLGLVQKMLGDLRNEPTRTIGFGPREMAMTREILQFVRIERGDGILELGGVSPSILTNLHYYLPQPILRSLSLEVPTPAARAWVRPSRAELLIGDFKNKFARRMVTGDYRFHTIFSLDGLSDVAQVGTSGREVLAILAMMLRPGGYLVLVNDFGRPPAFTGAEAAEAGFTVVSWYRDRNLTPELRDLIYGPNRDGRAGDLRGYLLRYTPPSTAPPRPLLSGSGHVRPKFEVIKGGRG